MEHDDHHVCQETKCTNEKLLRTATPKRTENIAFHVLLHGFIIAHEYVSSKRPLQGRSIACRIRNPTLMQCI